MTGSRCYGDQRRAHCFSGDCGIPKDLKAFKKWQDAHRYKGIDKIDSLRVNQTKTGFEPTTRYDGSAFSVEDEKQVFLAAFLPFEKVSNWDKLLKGDIMNPNSSEITRKNPVETMRTFIRCIGDGILKGVERNSRHGVMNGELVNLKEYAKAMLDRHGKIGDLNPVLQNFQVLRAFCYGKMNTCRAANTFDNVMMSLQELQIAHPVTPEHPNGTI